jgi:NAD(P)-dependent dehydrogenase (short-subunit alcohol dehydrogenase family)
MDVIGMRCLVTGTASGIGQQVVRELEERGAAVASLDRNQPNCEMCEHYEIDLSEPADIDRVLDEVSDDFDAVFNVAGVPGTFPDEQVVRVNFLGLRHLTEAVSSRIRPGGAIVNISSGAGWRWAERIELLSGLLATGSFDDGLAWFKGTELPTTAYNLSKEAVNLYTMSKVAELSARKVRINAIMPGAVETPILPDFEKSMGKEVLDGVKSFLGRHADPKEIARAAVYMASRDASWVNGTLLNVDGGITAAVLSGAVPAPEV